jgi:hypothetical protein
MVSRPSRGSGGGPLKAEPREGEVVDKGLEKTDGLLFGHGGVEPLWEWEFFGSVRAVDKAQAGTKRQESTAVSRWSEQCYSLPEHCVFTQSGAVFGVLVPPAHPAIIVFFL